MAEKGLKDSLFIVFSGMDNTGKTTLADDLAYELTDRGFDVFQTRTPGGTTLGRKLREVIINQGGDAEPEAVFFLFLSDMIEVYFKEIIPALQAGKIVICDRFFPSTRAFQGVLCKEPRNNFIVQEWLVLAEKVFDTQPPDVIFYLHADAETRNERRKKDAWFENVGEKTLAEIEAAYEKQATYVNSKWVEIDTTKPIDYVSEYVLEHILELVVRRGLYEGAETDFLEELSDFPDCPATASNFLWGDLDDSDDLYDSADFDEDYDEDYDD